MKKISHKRLHIIWVHLYEMSREGKAIKTKSRLVVDYTHTNKKTLHNRWIVWCANCISILLLFNLSVVSDCFRPHGLQHIRLPCHSPSLPEACSNSCPIESVMPSNHLILCRSLLLLPSIFPSIRVFSNELALPIRWSKYWSFSISPSNEYAGLISFRVDWCDLLAVQGTLKSLLQHHSSKYQFFDAQTSLWSSSHIHTWLAEKP